MSIKLRNSSWAGSLGGLFLCSSLGLALGACSGDTSDGSLEDPLDGPDGAMTMSPDMPATEDDESDMPSMTDEGAPNVTGLDNSMLPDEEGDPAEEDETDAANMSMLPAGELEVPASDHCAAVAEWDPEWIQFEEEVLRLVNEMRAQPADCGEAGQFAPAAPLAMEPMLRCSARLHSVDMYERDYFDHFTPDGIAASDRMIAAGFEGRLLGENIAQGQPSPEAVMQAWMDSDGHCANVMRPEYTLIGIGYSPGAPPRQGKSNFWTQNFGAPFADRSRR